MDNEKLILNITFNEESGTYGIVIPKGSNANETAFGIAAMIKALVRDKLIEKSEDFIDLITKYVNDPQYQEVE